MDKHSTKAQITVSVEENPKVQNTNLKWTQIIICSPTNICDNSKVDKSQNQTEKDRTSGNIAVSLRQNPKVPNTKLKRDLHH